MPGMIQLARMTNNGMPEYTVSILQDLLNERGYPVKGTLIAALARICHHPSTAATLCRTLPDFHPVRVLNRV